MKVYRVKRYDASLVDCRVTVDHKPSYQLIHVPAHSVSGFNCGYLGSGPGDLALSILVDYFEEDTHETLKAFQGNPGRFGRAGTVAKLRSFHKGESDIASRAVILHQQFKEDIVCQIVLKDGEHYDLSEAQIGNWLGTLLNDRLDF